MRTDYDGHTITLTLVGWEKEVAEYIFQTYGPNYIQNYLLRMFESKERGKLETEIRREFLERQSGQSFRSVRSQGVRANGDKNSASSGSESN